MSVLMQNLFTTDIGLMSLAVVVITIGIVGFLARMFVKLSGEAPQNNAKPR